jgi:hypothetical protein
MKKAVINHYFKIGTLIFLALIGYCEYQNIDVGRYQFQSITTKYKRDGFPERTNINHYKIDTKTGIVSIATFGKEIN